jgi:hypothetical protein
LLITGFFPAFSIENMISGFKELLLRMFNLAFHNTKPFLSSSTLQVSALCPGDAENEVEE